MKCRNILSILCLLLLANLAVAKTIDEATAMAVGSNYLKSRSVAGADQLTTVYKAAGEIDGRAVVAYYVFNVTGGHAFVMVSADDRIRPILAYSDESGYDVNTMSDAARDWADGYRNRVTAAIAGNVAAKASTQQAWRDLIAGVPATTNERTTSVGPLLGLITWNQEPYYNADCPGAGPYQAPTGCVATSMSQVMKYWNWPPSGTGYTNYQCTTYSATPINLAANFANTEYDWGSMADLLITSSPSVAQLMFHAGVSVEMEYDTTESGAEVIENQSWRKFQCTEYALKTYFHYKRSLQGVARNGQLYVGDSSWTVDSINETDWTNMLMNDLNAGRPVLYSGYGVLGGHAWVCDGWIPGGLFHFNWGWGGTGPNGYYTVDDLAPPLMGIGGGGNTNFNYDQAVIIGIQPDSFPNTPGMLMLASHLNCTTSMPMKYGAPFSIATSIQNAGSTVFTGDFCAQVFDTLNNMVGTIQTITGQSLGPASSASYVFGPSALYGMIPMDYYHIQVMYRPSGSSVWTPVANAGSVINYTTADVIDDTDIALWANISVATPLPVIPGAAMTISTKLYNQSPTPFNGTVQATMINVATGAAYPVQALTSQSIDSFGYYSATFTNPSFTAPDGLYALVVQHQYNGLGAMYTTSSDYFENPVLLTVGADNAVATQAANRGVYVFPNPAHGLYTILPHGVTITAADMYDVMGNKLPISIIPNGQAAISVPVARLAAGDYFVRIQTAEAGIISRKIVIE